MVFCATKNRYLISIISDMVSLQITFENFLIAMQAPNYLACSINVKKAV